MNGKGSADVTLYYDSLSSVKVSGANVSVAGVLSAVMLDIDLSAGATFGAELATKDTYMKVAGNSVANVTGTTKYFYARGRGQVEGGLPGADGRRCARRSRIGCRSLCERDRTSSDDCRYRGRRFSTRVLRRSSGLRRKCWERSTISGNKDISGCRMEFTVPSGLRAAFFNNTIRCGDS